METKENKLDFYFVLSSYPKQSTVLVHHCDFFSFSYISLDIRKKGNEKRLKIS